MKPGGEWNDVIGTLGENGVAIVGGRLHIGMSFLPCLTCPRLETVAKVGLLGLVASAVTYCKETSLSFPPNTA